MRVLDFVMNQLNIMTTMIYRILDCPQNHTKRLREHGDFMP